MPQSTLLTWGRLVFCLVTVCPQESWGRVRNEAIACFTVILRAQWLTVLYFHLPAAMIKHASQQEGEILSIYFPVAPEVAARMTTVRSQWEHRRWTFLFPQGGPENMFLHMYRGRDRHKWRMGKDFHDLASLLQCSAQLFWESTSSATFNFYDWGNNLNKYSSFRLALMRIKKILFLGNIWRGRSYKNYKRRLRVLQRMIIHRNRIWRKGIFTLSVLQFFIFSSLCGGDP